MLAIDPGNKPSRFTWIIMQRVTKGSQRSPGSGKTIEALSGGRHARIYRPTLSPSYQLSCCKPYLLRQHGMYSHAAERYTHFTRSLRAIRCWGDCSPRVIVTA